MSILKNLFYKFLKVITYYKERNLFVLEASIGLIEDEVDDDKSLPFDTAAFDSAIRSSILLLASALDAASLLISSATTANPLPASPALAASIEALSAKRLVWSANAFISVTNSLIFK